MAQFSQAVPVNFSDLGTHPFSAPFYSQKCLGLGNV